MISVGIDVSKGKSTVCMMKPGGEILKPPFEILHTIEGVLSLVKLIKDYNEDVKVVLEDTGYFRTSSAPGRIIIFSVSISQLFISSNFFLSFHEPSAFER